MMEHNDRQMILLAEPDMEESVLHRRSRTKHLKRRRRRFGFRLGVSCLSMLVITALLSVGGTFSKYTSQSPEIGIPSKTVGAFKNNVDFITAQVKENTSAYSLKDTDVLVSAFKITNYSGETSSVVDLNVDVEMYLSGKYTYHQVVTFPEGYPENPLLRPTVEASDSNKNSTDAVYKNVNFCNGLKSYLVIGKMQDDTFVETNRLPNTSASPISAPGISVMALPPVESDIPITIDLGATWTNFYTFTANKQEKLICLIIVDTNVTDDSGAPIKYTGPDLTLSGNQQGNDESNLTVTVSQAKSDEED